MPKDADVATHITLHERVAFFAAWSSTPKRARRTTWPLSGTARISETV